MIYLTCYLASCVLAYISFAVRKSDKIVSVFLSCIAILVPCILAGVRAPEIGTDVNVYVCTGIEEAKNDPGGLMERLHDELFVEETDGVLYTILLYLSSRLPLSLFIALFVTELLCVVPVYSVIRQQEISPLSKALALFAYYCFFYHLTLNIMKQCIAVSIMFWGYTLLKKNKTRQYLVLLVLTFVFVHKTAALALLVLILHKLSLNYQEIDLFGVFKLKVVNETRIQRVRRILIFIGLMVLGLFVLQNLRNIILEVVHYKHSYSYQLSHFQNYTPKYSNLFLMILILMPVLVFHARKIINNGEVRFYTLSMILSALLYQFCGASPALYRVSLYTLIIITLAIPCYVNLFRKDMKVMAYAYYSIILVMNFAYEVVMNQVAGVYPYAVNPDFL